MASYPIPFTPAEIYPAKVILVQFKHGVTLAQASAVHAISGALVRRQFGAGLPLFVVEPENWDNSEQVLESYQSSPIVAWAIIN